MKPTNKSETIGNDRVLTPRQETVAVLLASGDSIEEAARKSRCAAAPTVRAWLANQPAFKRRITELRADMTGRALGKLVDSMSVAADTLRRLCQKSKSETIQLKAAEAMFTHGVKVREAVELEERIAALEAKGGKQK